jgi:hypothetical protein
VKLVVALLAVAAGLAVARAQGDDDRPSAAKATSTDRVVAVAADPADVTRSVLVGPSGQAYDGDGTGWVRRRGGGVAADVSGAALAGGELVVAGRMTPMYRRTGDAWFALRLGEDGMTRFGSGPTPAVVIRRQVFVHTKARTWTRVGTIPGKAATAVWASGKTVWLVESGGVYRLKGKSFVRAGDAVDTLAGGSPWGITPAGLRHLTSGRNVAAELDGAAVTILAAGGAPGAAELTVVVQAGGKPVLATASKTGLTRLDDVPVAGAIAGLAVDKEGRVLVALRDGTVAVRAGGSWQTSQVTDQLPVGRDGPGPSLSH